MPRKPNYSFERRQREIAKAEKKAARLGSPGKETGTASGRKPVGRERRSGGRKSSKGRGGAVSGTDMHCEIATCGVASSPDRALVTLYLGSTQV